MTVGKPGVSNQFRAQLANAKSPTSEAGRKVSPKEGQALRETAAADLGKKTGWAPKPKDIAPYNAALKANGVNTFKGADEVGVTHSNATRRIATQANATAAKFLQGLHPVGSPQGYLDTAHASSGIGEADYPTLRVPYDAAAFLKEKGVKPGDKNMVDQLEASGEVMTRAAQGLLPGNVRGKVGILDVYPKSDGGLAKYGAEAFRGGLMTGKAIDAARSALTAGELKALKSVSGEFIGARADKGQGVIQLPTINSAVDPKVGQSAIDKLIAANPGLQMFAGLKFDFVATSSDGH